MAQPMSATARPTGPSEPPLTPLSGMPKRAGRQLTLIVIGAVALLCLQITIDMAVEGNTSVVSFLLPGAIFGTSLAAWALTRMFAPYTDPLFVAIASLLSGVGIIFIRRLSYTADPDDQIAVDAGIFAGPGGRQLVFYMAGVVLFGVYLGVVRNHRMMRGYAYILLFAGIGFAALPGFLPSSISEVNGSKNWIRLGGLSVQPSEFAKLMILIFFAVYLVRKRDMLSVAGPRLLGLQLPRMKDLGPIVIVWAACVLMLVFERDLGTSLLFFGIFLSMLYMATRRVSWIVIGLTLFFGACVAIYPFFNHLQQRVTVYTDPFTSEHYNMNGGSFQLVQGLIGLNEGGLLGNGPGSGLPGIVPFADSDFILATIGEELGLFGLTAILLLYVILVERGFKTGIMSRDLFGTLLAGGLAFLVAFQLFVVCGGITGLIPLTGQTTAFLAAGGSSMVGNWLLIALLVRVSDDARKPWQASFGLMKTEAPPEFLAEQAAKRAAEDAAKQQAAVAQPTGPVPDGDQRTELIIPPSSEPQGPSPQGPSAPQSPPAGPHSPPMSGPPMSGPPMSGPPMSGPPMSGPPMSGPPASPQSPPTPPPPSSGGPGGPMTRPAPPPPPPPGSAYGDQARPGSAGPVNKEGEE